MKAKTQKFGIFCNSIIGEMRRAESVEALMAGMCKRHKEFWSNIMFRDADGNTINITREFLQQGMTIQEVCADWVENACPAQLGEEIRCMNPKSWRNPIIL